MVGRMALHSAEENPDEVVAALDERTEAVIREIEAQHKEARRSLARFDCVRHGGGDRLARRGRIGARRAGTDSRNTAAETKAAASRESAKGAQGVRSQSPKPPAFRA
jgi:hypothetical protein